MGNKEKKNKFDSVVLCGGILEERSDLYGSFKQPVVIGDLLCARLALLLYSSFFLYLVFTPFCVIRILSFRVGKLRANGRAKF